MRTLDLTKPYGRVHPPERVAGTNRVQFFDQGGIPFDHAGQEIVRGATAPEESAPTAAPSGLTPAAVRHLERLVANGAKMPIGTLRREAGLMLQEVPATKPETIEALKARLMLHRAQA
jgi:hypothetical protein